MVQMTGTYTRVSEENYEEVLKALNVGFMLRKVNAKMLTSDWSLLLTLSSHWSGRPGLYPHHDHHRVRGPVEHGHQDHHEEHRPQVQVNQEEKYYLEDQMIVKCQHHNEYTH